MKQLLVDVIPFYIEPSKLNESTMKDGTLEVYGVLQRAEAKNQNGRRYPKEILMREAKKYAQTFIKERRAYGELDHPDSSVVEFKNTSHVVTELAWKGNDLMGKVKILNTPAGNILKEILRAGCTVGISSRGMGSVKELAEGEVEVQDDFELIAFDFVSNPSTHGAFLQPVSEGVLTESKRNQIRRKVEQYKYDKVNRIVRDIVCDLNGVCKL